MGRGGESILWAKGAVNPRSVATLSAPETVPGGILLLHINVRTPSANPWRVLVVWLAWVALGPRPVSPTLSGKILPPRARPAPGWDGIPCGEVEGEVTGA